MIKPSQFISSKEIDDKYDELDEFNHKLAIENTALRSILYSLVKLKVYDDRFSKDAYYISNQPLLWEAAKKALDNPSDEIEKIQGVLDAALKIHEVTVNPTTNDSVYYNKFHDVMHEYWKSI